MCLGNGNAAWLPRKQPKNLKHLPSPLKSPRHLAGRSCSHCEKTRRGPTKQSIRGSSNGRTTDSESFYLGPNQSPRANKIPAESRYFELFLLNPHHSILHRPLRQSNKNRIPHFPPHNRGPER